MTATVTAAPDEPCPGHSDDVAAYEQARQLTTEDLATMDPQEITDARDAGRLDRLLGIPEHEIDLKTRARTGQLTAADTTALAAIGRHDLIVTAHAEGRIEGVG